MKYSMIEEIEQAIYNISLDIWEGIGYDYGILELRSDGFIQLVKFMGTCIWNSEDDTRDDVDVDGNKEPMETYLRRVINKELSTLNNIKLNGG